MLFLLFSGFEKHKRYVNFNNINSWWLEVSCENTLLSIDLQK